MLFPSGMFKLGGWFTRKVWGRERRTKGLACWEAFERMGCLTQQRRGTVIMSKGIL